MTYVDEEERIALRAQRVSDWLHHLHDFYADLISRPTETSSTSGFDPEPRVRPCEHRLEWRRGKLCLGCDNTDWRPLTLQEKEDNLGIDPYAAEVKRPAFAVIETESMRKARDAARMDNVFSALERVAQVQAGLEVQETVESRMFRLVAHKRPVVIRIANVIRQLREDLPDEILRQLDFAKFCWLVAKIMPGTLRAPG